jgi:hypothetical protein
MLKFSKDWKNIKSTEAKAALVATVYLFLVRKSTRDTGRGGDPRGWAGEGGRPL